MLQELHIKNFALIDELKLDFGDGLNILTGETGAGKSIIIDALGFVLGERVTVSEIVRTGTDRSSVDAVFDLDRHSPVVAKIEDLGLTDEDPSTLFLSREVNVSNGKSQCRVNGRMVPVSVLKDIGDDLVDVHGQHEHQSLLSADRHVDILDQWCGLDALALRNELGVAVSENAKTKKELEQLQSDSRERARLLDLYQYQLEEIDNAALKENEEEELHSDRLRLANASKLETSAAESYELLTGGERNRGAVDLISVALSHIEQSSAMDETLEPIVQLLRESVSYAEDASRELRRYREGIEFNPERLEELENRLDLIKNLKRKYGDSYNEIVAYRDEIAEKLDRIEHSEARETELINKINKQRDHIIELAGRLTQRRKKGAEEFTLKITRELADLGMRAAQFECLFADQEITARGAERVEFLFSSNPGEPVKPLAKIASGGEMSRIMLAIKSAMAGAVGLPTMVFDEIDVGVGGGTAHILGNKLSALSKNGQILCITHLPQIAAKADVHFLIKKYVVDGRTNVSVSSMSLEQRVEEIVRMLGGDASSEVAVKHAREMLTTA